MNVEAYFVKGAFVRYNVPFIDSDDNSYKKSCMVMTALHGSHALKVIFDYIIY